MLRQLRHPRMDPPYHKSGSICSWQRPVEAFDCQLFRLDADGLGGGSWLTRPNGTLIKAVTVIPTLPIITHHFSDPSQRL